MTVASVKVDWSHDTLVGLIHNLILLAQAQAPSGLAKPPRRACTHSRPAGQDRSVTVYKSSPAFAALGSRRLPETRREDTRVCVPNDA